MHTNTKSFRQMKKSLPHCRKLCAIIALLILCPTREFSISVSTAFASTWKPTTLVNTEGFQIIDDSDSAANLVLRFGDTVAEEMFWNRGPARFEFTDDVHALGNITASGGLTVANASRFKAGLQVAGVLSGAKLSVMSGANAYIMSNLGVGTTAPRTKLEVTGVISGAKLSIPGTITFNNVAYTFPQFDGAASGKVLKTNAAGVLSWSADNDTGGAGITYANAVSYFVDDSGDTMTGALIIK
ncbi:MAG: hypothetical protein AAB489_03385, partial [Patescibacteria group bacterium]